MTTNEIINSMAELELVISRVLPFENSYIIEFKKEE